MITLTWVFWGCVYYTYMYVVVFFYCRWQNRRTNTHTHTNFADTLLVEFIPFDLRNTKEHECWGQGRVGVSKRTSLEKRFSFFKIHGCWTHTTCNENEHDWRNVFTHVPWKRRISISWLAFKPCSNDFVWANVFILDHTGRKSFFSPLLIMQNIFNSRISLQLSRRLVFQCHTYKDGGFGKLIKLPVLTESNALWWWDKKISLC